MRGIPGIGLTMQAAQKRSVQKKRKEKKEEEKQYKKIRTKVVQVVRKKRVINTGLLIFSIKNNQFDSVLKEKII